MREPYETLLAPLNDHWWVGQYLQDPTPDWDGILTNPYWNTLSSGEAVLLNIARAFYNQDTTATVADLLFVLDDDNRKRAVLALAKAVGL